MKKTNAEQISNNHYQTADGKQFESDKRYWFYDSHEKQIRSNVGLRPSGEYLWSFGFRVVPIAELRENKRDAVRDGRKRLTKDIAEIRELMSSLDIAG